MMNSSNRLLAGAVLLALVFGASSSFAAKPSPATSKIEVTDEASPINGDTRLVMFNYDANLSYNLIGMDSVYTHIELRPGELVQGFYLSDTTRWRHHVAANKERIFIKPTAPGLFNAATLVTNKRTYEITFKSVASGSPWYQRVRWSIPDEGSVPFEQATGVFEDNGMSMSTPKNGGDRQLLDALAAVGLPSQSVNASGAGSVRPETLNFSYQIEGDAKFKPKVVFDDGRFTWLQVSGHQDLPAVFSLNKDGGSEVINYTVNGDYIVITRLLDGILMKLGKDEVKVRRNVKCGFFGC
jgi:type IV secretion system protein VirB9